MPMTPLWYLAVVPSPGVRVAVAESLDRDIGKVSEWCDTRGIKLNASKTKTMVLSTPVTRNATPVTTVKYWQHCANSESDDLTWHIRSDIWFQDDVGEASPIDLQSSFSKAWYLEEVLSSI